MKLEISSPRRWWAVDGSEGTLYEKYKTGKGFETAVCSYPGIPLGEPEVVDGVGVRLVDTRNSKDTPVAWECVFETMDEAHAYVRTWFQLDPSTGECLEDDDE